MDDLKINEDFARKYDSYRQAEELQKLKDKYGDGDDVESSSSDSEIEDETAEAVSSKLEKDFFHTLACIKTKDPVLYKKDEKFFSQPSSDESDSDGTPSKTNAAKKSEKPFLLKDYERKVVLERNGVFEKEDAADGHERNVSGSYYAELDDIKKSFSEASRKLDEELAGDDDDMLRKKDSTHGTDDNDETTLDELDDYWKDPRLDEKEKFLRDYILDRKYLEEPSEDEEESEIEQEDEKFAEEEEKFEHAYNMRYEQPDHAFIKTYPRLIASSVRRKDERKKNKRQERKKRKDEEKRKKIEELKRLKQLKRQEIMEKVNRLKVATGNTDIKFDDHDVNDEFNPTEHDKRMQELFNDEFYAEEEDEKPQFSDIGEDEFGDATDWSQCNDNDFDAEEYDETIPDCEQPDFVMDCDYQPEPKKKTKEKKLKSKDKKKKSVFYETIAKEQSSTTDDKSMSEHLEEYYAMDFDDLIGDMPCRFKYRSVPANDYGLTTEDILLADNRTLNSWCSLKRVVQRRLPEEEDYLRRLYAMRARRKKDKYFEKFYKELEEKEKKSTQPQNGNEQDEGEGEKSEEKPVEKHRKLNSRQRRRKRDRLRQLCMLGIEPASDESATNAKKKKHQKREFNETYKKISKLNTSRLEAYGLKPKKVLSKAKYGLNDKKTKKKDT